jgi:nitrate/nitrite-specific signal transduction histidine kinase
MKKLRLSVGTSIRSRLLYSFLLIALLPALLISLTTLAFGYVSGQKKAFDQLESVAELKVLKIESWVGSLQNEIVFALSEKYALDRAQVVLKLGKGNSTYPYYTEASRYRFQRFVNDSNFLSSITLVDLDGKAVLSTDPALDGVNYSGKEFFQLGLAQSYIQILPGAHLLQPGSVVTTLPIQDSDGNLLGILLANANPLAINDNLNEKSGLGQTGKAYLVDRNFHIVSGVQPQQLFTEVHSQAVDQVLSTQQDGSAIYNDTRGKLVLGVYHWVPQLKAALLVEQDLSEALASIVSNLQANLAITLVMFVLAGAASLRITRSISRPVENLVEAATHIASGELERVASVERNDEIGSLANAFNQMTARLRGLINSLEERVVERTHALQNRARQLETIARISREITSILEIDSLLPRVVEQIQQAFHASHVNIFLVETNANQLSLFASSSGQHQANSILPLDGKSLNARAVCSNTSVCVNDVTRDPEFLQDEGLPDTRSELILPLRMGERVTGTLDVHSDNIHFFSDDDIVVLQSLGDQIAVAIENARLYESSRKLAVLEERERLSRDLHDSVIQSLYSLRLLAGGWQPVINGQNGQKVEEYFGAINQTIEDASNEMRLLIHELRPSLLEQEGLLGALHARLDSVEKRAGIETRLIADEYVELPVEVEKELYWIAQEALNNSLKHANAPRVDLHFFPQNSSLVLEIMDTGKGFDPHCVPEQGCLGLKSMAERAKKLGGALAVESKPGDGTTVRVEIPV